MTLLALLSHLEPIYLVCISTWTFSHCVPSVARFLYSPMPYFLAELCIRILLVAPAHFGSWRRCTELFHIVSL
jgi:hypothetical protein